MPYTPRSGGGRGGDIAQAGVFSSGMRRYGTEPGQTGDHEEEWGARNRPGSSMLAA